MLNIAATPYAKLLVPWHPCQQHAHPARVRKPCEQQTAANKTGKSEKYGMRQEAQHHTNEHKRTGHDANLALQRNRLLSARKRQIGLLASLGSTLDAYHI